MTVPNTEEIAKNKVNRLTVNIAGNSELLLAALRTDQEKERARILKGIHDEISPQLLSAVFLAQILKEKLEAKEQPESVMAAELSEVLVKVIDGLVKVLDPPGQISPPA
jgi:signal transduction histidine kinase